MSAWFHLSLALLPMQQKMRFSFLYSLTLNHCAYGPNNLLKYFLSFLNVCVCMHMWAHAHVHISASSCECQRHHIPLRLELQAVCCGYSVWVLGTKFWSSARQFVFLNTELSLHPLNDLFICTKVNFYFGNFKSCCIIGDILNRVI